MNQNEYLQRQVHCLNHKYASLKFTEFTEKLWLKQKLEKIHQNLASVTEPQRRQDTYGQYTKLTITDLVNKIKQVSKKIVHDNV
jgi:hypothetical protein